MLLLFSYFSLSQENCVQATYIWIDGTGKFLRSKTKTLSFELKSLQDLPMWNFDGSSTGLAQDSDSDVYLEPIALYPDPFRRQPNELVFCKTLSSNNEPTDMLTIKSTVGHLFRNSFVVKQAANFSGAGLTSELFMKKPQNEPVLTYKKGSEERKALDKALAELSTKVTDVPLRIGNEKITNKMERKQVMPSDHGTTIARFTHATREQILQAIETAIIARQKWETKSIRERADILLHAADLTSGKYRMLLNAATMLGQGKTIVQAEIDSACELSDFFRFNSKFALDLEHYRPISLPTVTNTMILRGLEGFTAAIAPFNFTAIGGNLPTAPTLMGNVTLWKPSDTAVLSNYFVYQALEEAGMPPGVISFLPSDGPMFGDTITASAHLAAINFTGSVPTFKYLWKKVAENLDKYVSFPKLVGECGGKNFHFIHPSADIESVVAGTVRSAFEYQGQKCSACSRVFIPESLWPTIKEKLTAVKKQIKVGDVRDGSVFMSAVIDANAFDRIVSYIEYARKGNDGAEIIFGGSCDNAKGYYIQPTLVRVNNWKSKLLTEEIFGPVLTAYVYPDSDALKVVSQLKNATAFGLTGAVFAQNKEFLYKARDVLRDAVGNMYLNDKSTGSVVGQQPFGGARMSGTNDKAGGPHYALRWSSPLVIKETHVPTTEWKYPSMD
uniref:Multifunctional fusion protein n=1 Tax=Parascaris univalens TaxID=6257 RepID=A0A914ZVL4_PARUN